MKRDLVTLMAVLLISQTAFVGADDRGFYLGASGGYSDLDEDSGDVTASLTEAGFSGTADADDNDFAWKVFVGYNVNAWFGVEAAYVDLGEVEGDFMITAPVPGTGSASADVDGFAAFAVARYPLLEQLDVFGKVGAFVWDVEGSATFAAGGATASTRDDDDGVDLAFGLGFEYEITKRFGVRAEWERYADISDDDNDVDLFSVGLEFDF